MCVLGILSTVVFSGAVIWIGVKSIRRDQKFYEFMNLAIDGKATVEDIKRLL